MGKTIMTKGGILFCIVLPCILQFSGIACAQDKTKLLKSIAVNAAYFTTDHLGQVYILKNDQLLKYDSQGNMMKTFSNKGLGNISIVDAGNPMRLLLFYRDFSRILFLDNMLGQIGGEVSLENIGFAQATLICTSNNNGIWIYLPTDFELVNLDQNLKVLHRSGNISQLTGTEITPEHLYEYNEHVYLTDPAKGILVFDIFGTYYKTIPLQNLKSMQVSGDIIYGLSDKEVWEYHLKTLQKQQIMLQDTGAVSFRIEKQQLYILKENRVDIYFINFKATQY